MGTIIRIPKSVEDSPTIPSGKYGQAEEARIVSSEVRSVPNSDTGELFWDIGVIVRHSSGVIFAHTSPFGRNKTTLTEGSRSRAFRFAKQLGIDNPEKDFDIEQVIDRPVIVDVELNEWTDKAGDKRSNLRVADIFLKS